MKRDLAEAGNAQRADVTIEIPTSMLLTLIERAFEAPTLITLSGAAQPQRGDRILPAIGADYEGGKFAGISLEGGKPVALVLLPGKAESINWKEAGEWAAKQGGVLPSRHDGIVLFNNLKSEFKDAWYWLDSQHAGEPDCAWGQYFGSGTQNWLHVNYTDRARAVRRVPVQ